MNATPSTREPLPDTRQSVTHKFTVGNVEGYLTIGLNDAGKPLEVFLKIAKSGSTLSGLLDGFCRALSLALRHGLPLGEAVAHFKGMRFEPMGDTHNPDIPEARSILDYIARWLELRFLPPPSGATPQARGV